MNRNEMHLWRDYERGAVGIETASGARKLLPPDEARKMADALERRFAKEIAADERDSQAFLDDLRKFADEVEQ